LSLAADGDTTEVNISLAAAAPTLVDLDFFVQVFSATSPEVYVSAAASPE